MESKKTKHTTSKTYEPKGEKKDNKEGSSSSYKDPSEDDSIEEIIRRTPPPGAIGHRRDTKQSQSESYRVLESEPKQAYTGRIQTESEVPEWFPKGIKKIFWADRHGGQFLFRELDTITRYRAAMERTKRRKWRAYLRAGRARWQLQKALRRMRSKPFTKAFYEYRKSQYATWKRKALKSWQRLEKLHLGMRVLDEAIDINFRQERMVYEKKLGGRLKW